MSSSAGFGNNVALKNGHYRVDVQVDSAGARFMVTLGTAKMPM